MTPLAEARTEDTEYLLHHGEHPENIVRRVGFTNAAAAERYFRVHGRHDLSKVFAPLTSYERKRR